MFHPTIGSFWSKDPWTIVSSSWAACIGSNQALSKTRCSGISTACTSSSVGSRSETAKAINATQLQRVQPFTTSTEKGWRFMLPEPWLPHFEHLKSLIFLGEKTHPFFSGPCAQHWSLGGTPSHKELSARQFFSSTTSKLNLLVIKNQLILNHLLTGRALAFGLWASKLDKYAACCSPSSHDQLPTTPSSGSHCFCSSGSISGSGT